MSESLSVPSSLISPSLHLSSLISPSLRLSVSQSLVILCLLPLFYEEEGCYFGVFHEDVFGAFAVGVLLLGFEGAVFAGGCCDVDWEVVVVEGVVEDHGGAAGVGGGCILKV